MSENITEGESGGNFIVCRLMGMGHDHLCYKFSEKTCMLCQLKDKYNRAYSLIVNNIDIVYLKELGVVGLFRDLTPKKGLSVERKAYVNNKLSELHAIKELIFEIENGKCN